MVADIMKPASFALIGAAGYVAPRHLQAMTDTKSRLLAACDKHDSVGILDRYFFETRFFQEFERFDRHLEKARRQGQGPDFVSICSPNYLHDAHIRFALRIGAHAICEKPLVINPWNIEPLEELAEERSRKIYPVLQLREHPAILDLRRHVNERPGAHFDVELTYITARGSWYLNSWKGRAEQSGGLSSNIGIHFFDALLWIFGPLLHQEVQLSTETTLAGVLELSRARVRWFLSIDRDLLPKRLLAEGKTTFRSLCIDDSEWEFSDGFGSLHTAVYRKALAGEGYSPADARPAIELTHAIREAEVRSHGPKSHRLLQGRFL